MNCTVIQGAAAGMAQHDIDILNIAQQNLVQQCIEAGAPASFSGTVQLPSTVAYPSGVVNATYSVSASSVSSGIGGFSSRQTPAASSTAAPPASTSAPAATESKAGAAGALRPAAAVGAVAAAAAIVMVL